MAGIAAVAALTGALAGCSTSGPSAPVKGTPHIGRCFDKPMPDPVAPSYPQYPTATNPAKHLAQYKKYEAARKAFEAYSANSTINLKAGANNTIQGDPMDMPANNQNTVNSATVQVETSDGTGTGTIVEGKDKKDVVVTAAHVLEDAQGPIDITDINGNETHVTSGCYVYQTSDKLLPLGAGGGQEIATGGDIAVLNMAASVGGAALQFASTVPARGSWEFLTNDQSIFIDGSFTNGDPTSPANFAGILLDAPANPLGYEILTGIQPWQGQIGGFTTESLTPGGSGGVVTDANANVIGMTVSSDQSQSDEENNTADYDGADVLSDLYNVDVASSLNNNPNFVPNPATMEPASMITYVLRYGDYAPAS